MFKKTLIAAAVVATTATFGANAATIASATSDTYTVEYAAAAKQVVSPDVTVTLGRDVDAGDIITITFAGATVATLQADGKTPVAITATEPGGNVEFLEISGNSVKALVTDPVSTGDVVTFAGVELDISGAADKGTVKVTSTSTVSTVEGPKVVDASTAAATVATFSTQFSAKVTTKLGAAKIDVNDSRESFVGGGLTDMLVVTNTNATAGTGSATAGAGTYVLHGDFSFLDVDGDGKLEAKEGSVTSSAGAVTMAEDLMSATVSATTFTAGTFGITITNAADTVIPAQSFTIDSDVAYTVGAAKGSKELLDGAAAGTWVLNGASVFVPFLPFNSTKYSQSVTVSNTSTQSGGVDLVVYVGDDTVEFEGIATVGGEGVTDISAAVRNAVATIGNGNYAMDIIVNAPEAAIEVIAVYYDKADGDRLRTK